jgi:ribosomal protein L11 methyltransferase
MTTHGGSDVEFAEIRVSGADPAGREWAAAEAFDAGARGIEERDGPPPELRVFVAQADASRLVAALRALPIADLQITEPAALAHVAWSEAWKEGLRAVVISERLLVRPPFVEPPKGFAGLDLVIEPGQAFGTGAHGSTRLALALLDGIPPERVRGAHVLDVGCGSGVLALAALGLGAARAVACDIDPLAPLATRDAARANPVGEVRVFTGSAGAIGSASFDIVVANMIRTELEPLLEPMAGRLAPGGLLVLSGLLVEERGRFEERLTALGLAVDRVVTEPDDRGDHWMGLRIRTSG